MIAALAHHTRAAIFKPWNSLPRSEIKGIWGGCGVCCCPYIHHAALSRTALLFSWGARRGRSPARYRSCTQQSTVHTCLVVVQCLRPNPGVSEAWRCHHELDKGRGRVVICFSVDFFVVCSFVCSFFLSVFFLFSFLFAFLSVPSGPEAHISVWFKSINRLPPEETAQQCRGVTRAAAPPICSSF